MPITKATANVVDFASPSSQIIAVPGDNLLTKYAQAITLTPQGNALSATNRATLIIYPGVYTLSAQWNVTAQFVDIFCIGHQFQNPSVYFTGFNMSVQNNDIRITGIGSNNNAIRITSSFPLNYFENCKGRAASFGWGSGAPANGTYIGCVLDTDFLSSGGFGSSSGGAGGTFIDCKATLDSFAGGSSAQQNQIASGIFIRCVVTDDNGGSFGYGGGFSGTARDCISTSNSFGAAPTSTRVGVSGTLIRCEATDGFGSGGAGTTKINGRLYFCINGSTYPTVTSPGITRVCFDGTNTQNNQG